MNEFLAFVTASGDDVTVSDAKTAWLYAERLGRPVYLAAFAYDADLPVRLADGPYRCPSEASEVVVSLAASGHAVGHDTLIYAIRHAPADVVSQHARALAVPAARAAECLGLTEGVRQALARLCVLAGPDVVVAQMAAHQKAASLVLCEVLGGPAEDAARAALAAVRAQLDGRGRERLDDWLYAMAAGGHPVARRLVS